MRQALNKDKFDFIYFAAFRVIRNIILILFNYLI